MFETCSVFTPSTVAPEMSTDQTPGVIVAGQYEEAIAAFKSLNGYKDSAAQIEACQTDIKNIAYTEAFALKEAGNRLDAFKTFVELGDYMDSRALALSLADEYLAGKWDFGMHGDYYTLYFRAGNTFTVKTERSSNRDSSVEYSIQGTYTIEAYANGVLELNLLFDKSTYAEKIVYPTYSSRRAEMITSSYTGKSSAPVKTKIISDGSYSGGLLGDRIVIWDDLDETFYYWYK